jgi:tRNA U34 5-methylaminomethyl-2-thiouridine-forming methyltransferase MnmC
MSTQLKIITTEDGSHSLYHPTLNETYHSFHGAYRESIHVFMLYGLETWFSRHPNQFPIRILEVGFGTGLNAWLSLVWAEQYKVPVLYHTLEPFPLENDIYEKLNYTEIDTSIYHFAPYFNMLHEAAWDKGVIISEYFNMKKEKTTLQEAHLYPSDLIFFDAFAPSKQPELWTKEVLEKVVSSLKPGGIFTTYSAKAQLKRDLASLGLEVETLPGPPGKKEMVRAIKAG